MIFVYILDNVSVVLGSSLYFDIKFTFILEIITLFKDKGKHLTGFPKRSLFYLRLAQFYAFDSSSKVSRLFPRQQK
jgi:hypothetical protein